MGINDRLVVLRSSLGLTRKEFAEKLGVSVRSIEGIETGGILAKGDAIEQVSKLWPELTLWLITGSMSTKFNQQLPNEYQVDYVNIIDSCDPRFIDSCIVNPLYLKEGHLVLIQNIENSNELGGLIYFDKTLGNAYSSKLAKNGAIWLQYGYLNFDSNHGGKNNLRDFRKWLLDLNGDLIEKARFVGLNDKHFKNAERNLILSESSFEEINSSKSLERFNEWKEGGDYLWPS